MNKVSEFEIINKDNSTYDYNPSLDYLPRMAEEKVLSIMKNSLKRRQELKDKKVNKKAYFNHIEDLIRDKKDDYDRLGRNLKEQRHRQEQVPWVKVRYSNGKLVIPNDKKEILVKLGLY